MGVQNPCIGNNYDPKRLPHFEIPGIFSPGIWTTFFSLTTPNIGTLLSPYFPHWVVGMYFVRATSPFPLRVI